MKKIDKIIFAISITYLVLPIIIQLFFWYNRLISIPLILMLLFSTFIVYRKYTYLENDNLKKIFSKKKIFIFIILIIILNVLSGAGGFFHQNWDYHGRNAIFHDLINHSWPVYYDYSSLSYESGIFGSTGVFNYYFAFWLPGAIVGKFFGFKIACVFMLFWQILGVSLFFYYVFRYMKSIKLRYFFIFLAFGGLNILGHIIVNYINGLPITPVGVTHIDTSMGVFCMSSFITQLFWVFNQSIPAWILIMLFLQDKDYKKCGYYFALLVPFGPFPMLGFLYVILIHIIFGKDLNKKMDKSRIKELVSIPNILGCISVLPIVFMYSLNESNKGIWFVNAYRNGTLTGSLINYGLFVLLEFLVYIIIVNRKNYKYIIMCFLFFAIAPLFYIGGADLGNRSTIPLLIIMYLLVIEYLNRINKQEKKIFIKQIVLIIILLFAFMTNYNEIYRSINYTSFNYKHHYSNIADSYQTFDTFEGKECSIFITNFVAKYDNKNRVLTFILRNGPTFQQEGVKK